MSPDLALPSRVTLLYWTLVKAVYQCGGWCESLIHYHWLKDVLWQHWTFRWQCKLLQPTSVVNFTVRLNSWEGCTLFTQATVIWPLNHPQPNMSVPWYRLQLWDDCIHMHGHRRARTQTEASPQLKNSIGSITFDPNVFNCICGWLSFTMDNHLGNWAHVVNLCQLSSEYNGASFHMQNQVLLSWGGSVLRKIASYKIGFGSKILSLFLTLQNINMTCFRWTHCGVISKCYTILTWHQL